MIAPTPQAPGLTSPLSSTQEDALAQQIPDPNDEREAFFNYTQARLKIDSLIKQWTNEIDSTRIRRNMRYIDVDLQALHRDNLLKVDETLIPIRVIDTSIKHELPSYMSFLTQSRRLAIFSCVDNPSLDTNLVEQAFTRGMMYSGWQLPLYKCVDGACTHGWDSVEVEYRDDRPLKVNIDHVGHENLLFAQDARDIEACELLLRRYELTVAQIKRFTQKFDWDYAQAYKTYARVDQTRDFQNIVLYKGMFKWDGIVYVFWVGDKECDDWVKAPMPLSLGREKTEEYMDIVDQPTVINDPLEPGKTITYNLPTPVKKQRQVPDYETLYPFKILCYAETEQQAITDYKGRCFLDGPKQEAQTALWSVLVNGSVRASNVYGFLENNIDGGTQLKKLDLNLETGCTYNQKMGFFNTPYPDPQIVRVSDGLETRTQIETGQPAFAVNNRQQDSRKTATEMNVAQQQQSMISSVSVTLFSVFMQKVLTHCWILGQAQALQGTIAFLQIDDGTGQKMNDMATINLTYDLRSAGDVDVVQRAEKLNRRMTMWPIIQATPLAMTFLGDMLTEAFPEDAPRYMQVMQQMAGQQQMVGQLANIIQHMALDDNGQIKPEFKQYEPQLQQLEAQLKGGQNAQGA